MVGPAEQFGDGRDTEGFSGSEAQPTKIRRAQLEHSAHPTRAIEKRIGPVIVVAMEEDTEELGVGELLYAVGGGVFTHFHKSLQKSPTEVGRK
jgi:hypothetical protein